MRLRGRDETAVWGELVFAAEAGTGQPDAGQPGMGQQHTQPFRFELNTWRLHLEETGQVLQLDEMGVVEKRVGD